MLDLKELKQNAEGFSILHVEDNNALRENASKLLKKIFATVYTAADGIEGLKVFKKHKPQIVITDIKMPKMSGVELTKAIRKISTDAKIVIMSAFDDKEYLYQAIELSVFRFLKKPVNLTELTNILNDAVSEIKHEENERLFHSQLQNIFNYQSSMVIMIKDKEPILANQMFLDFFNIDDIEEFNEKYGDFGNQLLEHDGFLYNKADKSWLDEIHANAQKLYHIKLLDKEHAVKHFILKYQTVPNKKGFGILSFDDITELNLLKLFDEKRFKNDENLQDSKALFKLLEVLKRNSAKVHLHNYYKGLSITNEAVITEVKDDSVVLKTNYLQEKAVQYEHKSLIVSDALPNTVSCDSVVSISFESQSVEFKKLHFVPESPIQRKTVRVVPEESHSISLFLDERKFHTEIKILDISLDAIKLELSVLPAGMRKDTEVVLDMVLSMNKKPLIIHTNAIMYRKEETRHSFNVVFIFQFQDDKKRELVKYITDRQMAIIREFKGLQNG